MKSKQTVIRVENLKKTYGDLQAVIGVSFSVDRGEIFGLLGPNGAGKTTTLSIVEGLLQADAGTVNVLGLNGNQNATEIKQKIGVQLQRTSLLPDLSVIEQIMLFSQLYGYQIERQQALAHLERVGLDKKADAFPDNLSGGQQQRLALALALVNNPEIVFLDEPTTGLDPQSRRALWEIIRELQANGKTVILTTHYMEEAEALCHRVGIIDHGKIIALAPPGDLVNQLKGFSTVTTSAHLPVETIQRFQNVAKAEYDGELIRIQTQDITTTLSELLVLSKRVKVSLNDIHISQPSLEDVFLHLTGRTIREA
ncbi:MAG: ABC transporter ATP-binding protein [Anaerolineaceae bacterium]|nr:ABC transporter ATP-binding protein [Anaerolineaceae bacterium]